MSDSFHLKPLLDVIQGRSHFHVVTLNHRQIRLYRGNEQRLALLDSYSMQEVDDLAFFATAGTSQSRGAPMGAVGRSAVSQLPSSGRVEDFVRSTESLIRRRLGSDNAPVLLIGSPLLRRFYRNVCGHRFLVKDEVSATFGAHEQKAIHRAAWPLVSRELSRRSEDVVSTYKRLKASGRASSDIADIARDAVNGRISDLLVSKDDGVFGRLNRKNGRITEFSREEGGVGDDVLCDIAQEVIRQGGSAHVIARPNMPTASPAAAICRW